MAAGWLPCHRARRRSAPSPGSVPRGQRGLHVPHSLAHLERLDLTTPRELPRPARYPPRGRAAPVTAISYSKRLLERPQVYLLGPGRAVLAMDLPVSLGDRRNAEQTILTALLHN